MNAMLYFLSALVLAPLLPGVINRVKAVLSGRSGKPVLQLYFDLARLLRKGAVYSHTTTWVFRAGPMVGLACMICALCLLPFAGEKALIAFPGDFLLAAYLPAMGRFASIAAALDTGSAFEGMGASREATYSALAEPVFLLALMPLGLVAGSFSLSTMLSPAYGAVWSRDWPILLLIFPAFFLVLLTENSRIPVDDPNTHLELTMIHEVMVLDHGGVDLAFIEYAAALKLWFYSSIIGSLMLPHLTDTPAALIVSSATTICIAVMVGVTESTMARLRLVRVPKFLTLAGALAALACLLCLR